MYLLQSTYMTYPPGNRRHDHVVSRECLGLSSDIEVSTGVVGNNAPQRYQIVCKFGYIPDMKLR